MFIIIYFLFLFYLGPLKGDLYVLFIMNIIIIKVISIENVLESSELICF